MIPDSRFIRSLPGGGKVSSVGQMQTAKRRAHHGVTYPWSQHKSLQGHECRQTQACSDKKPSEISNPGRGEESRRMKGDAIKNDPKYNREPEVRVVNIAYEQYCRENRPGNQGHR